MLTTPCSSVLFDLLISFAVILLSAGGGDGWVGILQLFVLISAMVGCHGLSADTDQQMHCEFADESRERACNAGPCLAHCTATWGDWSRCSEECGGGIQKRVYHITRAQVQSLACLPVLAACLPA